MIKSFDSRLNSLRGHLKREIEMASSFNINRNNNFLSKVNKGQNWSKKDKQKNRHPKSKPKQTGLKRIKVREAIDYAPHI